MAENQYKAAAEDGDIRLMQSIDAKSFISRSTYGHVLINASSKGDIEVVEYLLRKNSGGRDVVPLEDRSATNGETALHRAAINGHFKVVEALLKADANAEAVANKASTPALYAKCKMIDNENNGNRDEADNYEKILNLLLDYGSAEPEATQCNRLQGNAGRIGRKYGGSRKNKKQKKTRKHKHRLTKRRT
jgi:hypothetical protein